MVESYVVRSTRAQWPQPSRLPLSLAHFNTADSANNALSWTVSSKPWEDGDKLMLRIRKGPNGTATATVQISVTDVAE